MLRAFICEDDINYLNYVRKCVENYISIEGLGIKFACAATTPAELLNYLQNN